MTNNAVGRAGADEITCEVCIVGAGITGMNALVVATGYLASDAKVVLADSRARSGGMWVDTYDYVRLHQPHAIFTAGDIDWTLKAKPSHLASKPEVLDHFEHCLSVARARVHVEERFGWDYVSHEESPGSVRVVLRASDGRTQTVHAKRLIKAFGHQVQPNRPLVLSSQLLRSVTPEMLGADDEVRGSNEPVWIVGSGKTAMDTAHLLLTEQPKREVHLVAGPGTVFARRDTFFPSGVRRWWGGTLINSMVSETSLRFDGTNEDDVRGWFTATYGISPMNQAKDFFSAYLSDAECAVIKEGLQSVEEEYLADAVDRDGRTELVFRSGRTRQVSPESWVVNCTGSLLRTDHPYEPFVSTHGNTLSIQMRSSTTGVFSSFAGYYMTHLMFADKLRSIGLYELDIQDLHRKAKPTVFYASASLSMHNLSLIADALPSKVLLGCGLDFDLWYPMPRRMVGAAKFLKSHRRNRAHHRKSLDTLGQRFDVRAGRMGSVAGSLTD